MAELFVAVSKVREVIGEAELRTDSQLPEALHQRVVALLNGAMNRARKNGRATVRPDDLAGARLDDAPGVVVASRVQQLIRASDLRVDANLVEALNGHLEAMLSEAIERARANGRSTVRPYDLPAIR
ncbi:MAG: hypothetical protein M3252_00530 [Actinomycetota bacterium]|nr:hypothetical protein [Actinomycetota bacterium]